MRPGKSSQPLCGILPLLSTGTDCCLIGPGEHPEMAIWTLGAAESWPLLGWRVPQQSSYR